MVENIRRKIAIVGLGSVGKVLARLISESSHEFVGGFSRTRNSTLDALNIIGTGRPMEPGTLGDADTVIISVPDSKIVQIARELSSLSLPFSDMTFIHCSGSLGKEVLHPLENRGAKIAIFHPLFPFIDFQFSIENVKGAYVAVEGPEWLYDFAKDLGFLPFPAPERKELYHLGAVYSSGLFLALLSIPMKIADELNIPREAYIKLAESALKGILKFGLKEAITGPWKRGDEEIIKRHIEVSPDPSLYLKLLDRVRKILSGEDQS